LRRLIILIILIILIAGCRYNPPEGRIGDYVWFGEIWTDTLDTAIVYFDSVYVGTDKLGYGMTGGVVWFVVGDTTPTACDRDFREPGVYQFQQSEEFDKRYRYTFFNWDDSLGERVFKEGRFYTFCAAEFINGVAKETLRLKGRFPTKPRYTFYDTLRTLEYIPDTLYKGRVYTFVWNRDYLSNWYMVRLVGRDTTYGFYYCYKEILDTVPRITFEIPSSSDECYYDMGPIFLELVNVQRIVFDSGYAFGEFRLMSRVRKTVSIK